MRISQICILIAAVSSALILCSPIIAEETKNGPDLQMNYEARLHKSDKGTLAYRFRIPDNYDKAQAYPLILLLHGAGERGADNAAQLKWGGDLVGNKFQKDHPCFVIAPQCPNDKQWVNTPWNLGSYSTEKVKESDELAMAIETVQAARKEFNIDAKRIYVMGLSMGGFGTWDAAIRHPDLFAAAVPICGGGDPSKAKDLKGVSVWAFHGDKDSVVPTTGTREMIEAMKKADLKPKYTEYPGVDHASWINAFDEKELPEWLFAQKK